METLYAGLDVSKDDFKASVIDFRNNPVSPVGAYTHDRESLDAFLRDIQALRGELGCDVIFGMEATGIYHLPLYHYLLDAGCTVRVFNGLEVKRYKRRIRKTKTDNLDSLAIAEALLFSGELPPHGVTGPETGCLRELCRFRDRLMKKASKCKNEAIRDMDLLCRGYSDAFEDIFSPSSIAVMKAVVRKTRLFEIDKESLTKLLRVYMPQPLAEKKAHRLIRLFESAVVPSYVRDAVIFELHMLVQQHEQLRHQLKRVEREIESSVRKAGTHLLSIPGIGKLTAGVILGEWGDISRFKNLKQLTAYAGLDPSVAQSGRSKRTGRISKRGSPLLRAALYRASLSAIRFNPACRQLYTRLKARGKHHKVCLVAVANKLLHIAYSVEINQRDFYVPAYVTD